MISSDERQTETETSVHIITVFAGLDASGDGEPETADGENNLLPQLHQIILLYNYLCLPPFLPPISAIDTGDSHGYSLEPCQNSFFHSLRSVYLSP